MRLQKEASIFIYFEGRLEEGIRMRTCRGVIYKWKGGGERMLKEERREERREARGRESVLAGVRSRQLANTRD